MSTNDGYVGDCAMDDDGANETSRAAGNGQRWDNCDRGIEKTLRRRKEKERGGRNYRASDWMNGEKGREVMIQDQGEWGGNNGMCWIELMRSQHKSKSDPGEKSARDRERTVM